MSPDCWIFVTERPPDFSRPRTRRGRFPWACGVPPRRRMVHGIFEKGVGNLSRPVVPMEGHWLATGGQPPRVSPGPHGRGTGPESTRIHAFTGPVALNSGRRPGPRRRRRAAAEASRARIPRRCLLREEHIAPLREERIAPRPGGLGQGWPPGRAGSRGRGRDLVPRSGPAGLSWGAHDRPAQQVQGQHGLSHHPWTSHGAGDTQGSGGNGPRRVLGREKSDGRSVTTLDS